MKVNQDYEEDSWKTALRKKLISVVSGQEKGNVNLYTDIGICYQCYAPASLFKYYSDCNQNLEAVKANKMWYSAPCCFNDVFDCDIMINDDKLFDSILEMCPSIKGFRKGSPMWLELKSQAKKSSSELKKMFANMRSKMGIACMSELDNSLLMWAHYANNHRGMCVEYNLLAINRQLNFTPIPIIYSNDRVCFETLNTNTVELDATKLFVEGLTSKSLEWNYEKEWRIIRDDSACGDKWDDVNKGALLESIRPSSIILGCEANKDFENEVREHCDANKINLYKMEKDRTHYQLNKNAILKFDD